MRDVAAAVFLMFALSVSAPARAAEIVIGGTDQSNCFPFGACPYVGEYQQIYSATSFTGPVTITEIAFALDAVLFTAPRSLTDTFTLSLSTTSASPTTASTSYAANKGADFVQVFSGTISALLQPGSFDFIVPLTTPFTFNPAGGNLLLDVVMTSATSSAAPLFFEFGSSSQVGRIFNFNGNGAPTFQSNLGLLTEFTVNEVTTAPEPASMLLFGTGLVGAGVRRWRQRRA
jgi:hypothetical protein